MHTAGQNSYGELGHADTLARPLFRRVERAFASPPAAVACGNEHTAVLLRNGDLLTAGYNDNGQCGQGHIKRVPELTKVAGVKAGGVFACNGCEHTCVVDRGGGLLTFGYNYRGQLGHGTAGSELVPRPVRGLEGKRVRTVSCSYYHTAVLTHDDLVYSFGRNDFGQLGHGDLADKKFPHPVDQVKGRRLLDVGCGQYHTCVATRDGKVLACGKNDYGQLGLDAGEPQKRLGQVRGKLDGERVKELKCGYYHTVCRTERGRVYGFGRNDYGQLGLGPAKGQRVHGPHVIEALEGKQITSLAAGCYHSIFASADGILYVCGRNNHGQLGTGDLLERHSPVPVDTFRGERIAAVAAGFYHTVVLTGGEDDNNSSNADSAESSPHSQLSSKGILNLPCLSFPPSLDTPPLPSSSSLPRPASAAPLPSANNNDDPNLNSNPDELHPTNPDEEPKEDPPLLPPPSSSASPISSPRAPTPAPSEHPDGTSLRSPDGTVRQDKAALFLLAHMERLALSHVPASDSDAPTIGLFASSSSDPRSPLPSPPDAPPPPPTRERYCVDVSPANFRLLLNLVASVHSDPSLSPPPSPRSPRPPPPVRATGLLDEHKPYLLLSCLRILKANLCRLLQIKDLAGPVRSAVMSRKSSLAPAAIEEFVDVLFMIHHALITIIESPSYFPLAAAASSVQDEAASILIMGVELFYPFQIDQTQLLADLFACPSPPPSSSSSSSAGSVDRDSEERGEDASVPAASDDDDDDASVNSNNSNTSSPPFLSGLAASRYFLLGRLMSRLSDDSITCFLVPNPGNFHQDVPGLLTSPSPPVVSNLNAVMRLLVKQLALNVSSADTPSPPKRDGSPAPRSGPGDWLDSSQSKPAGVTPPYHQALIVRLILSLFKHGMHWAATESTSPPASSSPSPPSFLDKKAMLDHCLSSVVSPPTPSGCSSLLEFTTLSLLHSIDLLTALLKVPPRQQFVLSISDANRLSAGAVGTVLPSVVSGLLPFASRPLFARRLLPLVTKFVQRLDRLVTLCPSLVESSSDFEAMDDSNNGPPLHPSSSSSRYPSPPLPWLASLVKASSLLAGSLARTLVTAKSLDSPSPPPGADSTIAATLGTSLFRRGIAEAHLPALARFGLTPPSSSRPTSSSSTSPPHTAFLDEMSKRVPAPLSGANHSRPRSATNRSSSVALAFVERVRHEYASRDVSYAIVLKQAKLAGGHYEKLECTERLFFAAALKHEGLAAFAMSAASRKDKLVTMPFSIILAWRAVAESTKWLWRRRSQLKSESASDARVDRFFGSVHSSLSLLLLLEPSISPSPLRSAHSVSTVARKRWARAINFVVCGVRFGKILERSRCVSDAPLSTLYSLCGPQSREIFSLVIKNEAKDGSASALPVSVQTMTSLLMSCRRASSRIVGLNSFYSLLSSITSKSTRGVVLSEFSKATKHGTWLFSGDHVAPPSPSSGGVLDDVVAIGAPLKDAVTKAFEQNYNLFLNELNDVVTSATNASAATAAPPSFSFFNAIEGDNFLLLLDVWGIDFQNKDYLAKCGIVETLHKLLAVFNTEEKSIMADTDPGTGSKYKSSSSGSLSLPSSNLSSDDPGANKKPPAAGNPSKRNALKAVSSTVLKEKEAKLRHCKDAIWVLLRVLVVQTCCFVDQPNSTVTESDVSSVLDVVLTELNSSLSAMAAENTILKQPSSDASGSDASAKSKSQAASNAAVNNSRRCQELVSNPKRFSSEDGMKFQPEQLLHNNKGSDFSIAFWLYLTQDCTGKHRSLVVRGHKHERWPVMLLRPNDRRIDVGYSSASPVISSNASVPLKKWTHIALVSDNNKLKLYFNGTLDNQRSNTGHLNSPRTPKFALYVGKVPEGSVKIDGVRGGFEGSVAFMRFYSRALQPIHVRIVCDQGPPEAMLVKDRKCYQLCACLTLIAGTDAGKRSMIQRKWLDVFLKMFVKGTVRVQQAVVRIWKLLLPLVSPTVMAGLTVTWGEDGTAQNTDVDENAFAKYLVRVVGLSLWRNDDDGKIETARASKLMTLSDVASSPTLLLDTLPFTIASCCTKISSASHGSSDERSPTKASSSGSLLGGLGSDPDASPDAAAVEAMTKNADAIASEVIALLQHMLSYENWGGVLLRTIRDCFATFSKETECIFTEPPAGERPAVNSLVVADGFAVLSVLGGHLEELRPGIEVAMTHTDVSATVVHFDEDSSHAHVVMHGDKSGKGGATESGRDTIKISSEEILVEQSSLKDGKAWAAIKASSLMEEVVVPMALKFLTETGAVSEKADGADEESEDEEDNDDGMAGADEEEACAVAAVPAEGTAGDADADAREPEGDANPDDADDLSFADGNAGSASSAMADATGSPSATVPPFATVEETAGKSNASDKSNGSVLLNIVLSQTRSRFAKLIYRLALEQSWIETLCKWPNLVRDITALAVVADSTPTLAILEETEARVWFMRKRLFQLLTKSGRETAEAIEPMQAHKTSPAPGVTKKKGDAAAADGVGLSYILCPFCGKDNMDEVALAEHILDAHANNNRNAVCPICYAQRGDQSLHDLPSHMDIYHLDGNNIDVVNLGVGPGNAVRSERFSHPPSGAAAASPNPTLAERIVAEGDGEAGATAAVPLHHMLDSSASSSAAAGDSSAAAAAAAAAAVAAAGDEEEEEVLLGDIVGGDNGEDAPTDLIEQLMQMGFREEWCALALRENNNDVEFASTWIVDNLDFLTNLGTGGFGLRQPWNSGDGDMDNDAAREDGAGGEGMEQGMDVELEAEGEAKNEEGGAYMLEEELKDENDAFGAEGMDRNDARLQLVDNLEAEGAAAVFEENYFGDHAAIAGYDSRDGGRGAGPGGGMYSNYSDTVVVGTNASHGYRNKQVEEDISAMDLGDLIASYNTCEKLLSILHSRAAVVQLLHAWPGVYGLDEAGDGKEESARLPSVADLFGSQETLAKLLKISCFRGVQYSLFRSEGKLDGDVSVDGLTNPVSALRPFLCAVLKNSSDVADADADADRDADADFDSINTGSFAALLLNSCLDDVEAAASIEAFDEMAWFSRSLNTSDSQALLQPSVELASWLLDLLLYSKSPCMFKVFTYQRVASCLLSANVPIKDMCLRVIRSILVEWFDELVAEDKRGEDSAEGKGRKAKASDFDDDDGESDNDSRDSDTDSVPTEKAMVQLIADCIPLGRLKRIASQRAAEERRHERVFMSQYTRNMTQLIVAAEDLLQFIDERAKARGDVGNRIVSPKLPMVEDLQMAVLSENALSITWTRGSTGNDSGGAGEEEEDDDGCSSELYKYEVEMATKTVLDEQAELTYTNIYSGYDEECVVENLLPSRKYSCRARVVGSDGQCGEWCDVVVKESSSGVAFTFDRASSGPSIFVSTDGLSASFGSNESWSTVMASTPFISGVNYWEIRIDKSQTAYLFIGVAAKQADTSTFLGGDDFGWGYIGDRALYHKRAKVKVYGERFGQGDIIGVCLDLDNGTLSFSRNGERMGNAFTGLAGELYPAVAFYNQGQRVSLVRGGFRCPDAGMLVDGCPNSCELKDVKVLSSLMGSMCSRSKMKEGLVTDVWRKYNDWACGRSVRYITRVGFELLFDCSTAALGKYGVKKDDLVETPRGSGRIVGVNNGMLWLHVEDEAGAWFFKDAEIFKGKEEGHFDPSVHTKPLLAAVTATAADGKESVLAVSPRADQAVPEEKKASGDGSAEGGADGAADREEIGLDEFKRLADCDHWNAVLDGQIVAAINSFVERFEVSPWNLDQQLLMRAVGPVRSEINRLSGKEVGDDMIKARYGVLSYFNSVFVNTFPFVGVGEGLQLSGKGVLNASTWGLPGRRQGLGVGYSAKEVSEDWSRLPSEVNKDWSRKSVYAASLGLDVMSVALRNSCFFVVKRRIVNQLLERTVTTPKKAEDEYDYPEDLPQVQLNRPKAAAGKTRKNPVQRISMSLFGQLFDELHFIEPTSLRIGYTHPMDDGQERTFKVKFEGEGVDDYGGPYREIFGQLAGELQALESDVHYMSGGGRKMELGEKVKCVLPLLCPTRNWREGAVGGGVGGGSEDAGLLSDIVSQNGLFVPAPGLKSRIYMEMYAFVGQIIGIALRSRICTKFRFPSLVWKALVGESVDVEDLRAYDEAAFSVINEVGRCAREIGRGGREGKKKGGVGGWAEGFDNVLGGLKWVGVLSDGTEIELCPGGGRKDVTVDNCGDFVKAMVACRLHESDRALSAMRDGVASVIPGVLLPLLTWSELELLVCGKEGVDVDLLMANTEYDDDISVDSPHIQSFWRVFRGFDNEDRSRLLRFVWARERLPNSGREFHQKFKIQAAVGEGAKDNPDTYLPKAHTCFFSLGLPKYSSDEVMKEKLLYAIYNCIEMDADFKLADSEGGTWGQDEGGGGGGGGGGR
ncbi:hypothetical protein TeGR_g2351, partial [Tetraparma gracilis]